MIDIVKRFFGKSSSSPTGEQDQNAGHDVRVATCALFVEMAQIDETFSPEELQKVISILESNYDLSPDDAQALIAVAQQEIEEAVDYWNFAKLINENYSTEEKLDIITTLWEIVYVDGKLDKYEHYLMRKLTHLLRLTHHQVIDAKLKVINALSSTQ